MDVLDAVGEGVDARASPATVLELDAIKKDAVDELRALRLDGGGQDGGGL